MNWGSCFYQYRNRLAHLYLLRALNEIDAWLVNIYFYGDSDMKGPMTPEEWQGEMLLMKSYLGLGRHKLRRYELSLIIDVNDP